MYSRRSAERSPEESVELSKIISFLYLFIFELKERYYILANELDYLKQVVDYYKKRYMVKDLHKSL